MSNKPIVLLTDFGLKDHYVGVTKGVILAKNKNAQIIDLSHDIESQDVMGAYFLLQNSYRYFPKGTVFVVIVDPTVGSDRDIVCVRTKDYLFLAPDNGVLSFLYKVDKVEEIYNVTNTKYFLPNISNTFHGRDIFAPVAAHLSLGFSTSKLGRKGSSIKRLGTVEPSITDGVVEGEVVSIDKFGNLITNISKNYLEGFSDASIKVKGKTINGIIRSYAGAKGRDLLATIGSSGYVEISVNRGNAAKKLAAKVGEKVSVRM